MCQANCSVFHELIGSVQQTPYMCVTKSLPQDNWIIDRFLSSQQDVASMLWYGGLELSNSKQEPFIYTVYYETFILTCPVLFAVNSRLCFHQKR